MFCDGDQWGSVDVCVFVVSLRKIFITAELVVFSLFAPVSFKETVDNRLIK